MVAAPDEHPRLLFDASQLATLRQESTGGLRARVLAHLRAVCADRMDPASSRYFDFRERRNDYWHLRAGLFTVLPALNALTIGYAFTGDPAIGDCARDALLEIVDHGLADVASGAWGSHTAGWRHGPGHDKGKLNRAVAWLYDCCHDRFTPAQRRRVIDFAHEFVRLADEWRRVDWTQIGNNRGVRGILGSTWLYLAIEGEADLPDLEERLAEGRPRDRDLPLPGLRRRRRLLRGAGVRSSPSPTSPPPPWPSAGAAGPTCSPTIASSASPSTWPTSSSPAPVTSTRSTTPTSRAAPSPAACP